MRLIMLIPKGGQSCQEPCKATFHKWIPEADHEMGEASWELVLEMEGSSRVMPSPSFCKWGKLRL